MHYICALLLSLIPLQSALAIEGVITERSSGCPYFVVKTGEAYAVMQWNGESKPDRNDRLVGNYAAGAMNLLNNATRGGNVKVWIEDYPLSYDDAMKIYRDECK
jgi:hypothetical protein